MSRYGLLARSDSGGLGAQTLAIAKHVRAARILIVDAGRVGRPPSRPERFAGLADETRVCGVLPSDKDLDWLLDGNGCIYTAEANYNDRLPRLAAKREVPHVIHANPEMWQDWRDRGPTSRVMVPTSWEMARIPNCALLPMPVDRTVIPFRAREAAVTFWHPASPAMADRNGSDLVCAAMRLMRQPARFRYTGSDDPGACKFGEVDVEFSAGRANYWDGYETADVLVIPRRYGGLSLPVQEALAAGMPVVMLDLPPYAGKPGIVTIPTTTSSVVHMRGGEFPVYDADPAVLAQALDDLVAEPSRVAELSLAADQHARLLDWAHLQGAWERLLRR